MLNNCECKKSNEEEAEKGIGELRCQPKSVNKNNEESRSVGALANHAQQYVRDM